MRVVYNTNMTDEATNDQKPKLHTVPVPDALYAAIKDIAAKEERGVHVVVRRLLQKAVDSYQG